jgi:hypothetical protein
MEGAVAGIADKSSVVAGADDAVVGMAGMVQRGVVNRTDGAMPPCSPSCRAGAARPSSAAMLGPTTCSVGAVSCLVRIRRDRRATQPAFMPENFSSDALKSGEGGEGKRAWCCFSPGEWLPLNKRRTGGACPA